MSVVCNHEYHEKEIAIADGVCPLCQMAFCLQTNAEIERLRATTADLTAQRDASISDVVRMGSLYDKCAAKDATIADLTAALRAILDQDTVSDEAEHLRHIAAAALARAQAAEDNDWGCAPLTSGASGCSRQSSLPRSTNILNNADEPDHPFWCAHEWFRLPLALRHRWWKETDYGNQHATPELIAECQAALDLPITGGQYQPLKGGPPEGWTPDRTWQGGKE